MRELHYQSLSEVALQIENRSLSPVELTEALLSRIAKIDPKLSAYATVTAELALDQARQAEQEISAGRYLGPLHGVPIAVKDLFATDSVATMCGSKINQQWIPDYDAQVVGRLKTAGSVLLGKLNMTEFALSGYHPEMPVPVNPWAADRWSGVSSSGSAVATAAGLAFGTLGSDTGGSIRFPCAVNGVVGIKPTFGTVSTQGAFPLAQTLDHIGPITRTVRDAAVLLEAIAGFDPGDPFSIKTSDTAYAADIDKGIAGLVIGVDEAYCSENVHPEVSSAVLETLSVFKDAGARIVAVNLTEVLDVCPFWAAVVAADAMMAHAQWFPERADEYGPVFRGALEAATQIGATDYAYSRVVGARTTAVLNAALEDVNVLLCPSAPLPAMPLEDFPPQLVLPPEAVAGFVGFSAPTNFSGHPTISVPCGFTGDKLPLSLQLIGAHGDEKTLIRTAHAYEGATQWHHISPPID